MNKYSNTKDATYSLGPREFNSQSKFRAYCKRCVSCRNSKSFSFYGEILGKTSICKLDILRLFQRFTSNESMHDQFIILNFNGFCLTNQRLFSNKVKNNKPALFWIGSSKNWDSGSGIPTSSTLALSHFKTKYKGR